MLLLRNVEGRVVGVEIARIHVLLSDAQGITKALIVHKLTLAQIAQGVAHVGVVAKANQVVVGDASLLLCCIPISARSQTPLTAR